jgi:hypothetical protein
VEICSPAAENLQEDCRVQPECKNTRWLSRGLSAWATGGSGKTSTARSAMLAEMNGTRSLRPVSNGAFTFTLLREKRRGGARTHAKFEYEYAPSRFIKLY